MLRGFGGPTAGEIAHGWAGKRITFLLKYLDLTFNGLYRLLHCNSIRCYSVLGSTLKDIHIYMVNLKLLKIENVKNFYAL